MKREGEKGRKEFWSTSLSMEKIRGILSPIYIGFHRKKSFSSYGKGKGERKKLEKSVMSKKILGPLRRRGQRKIFAKVIES